MRGFVSMTATFRVRDRVDTVIFTGVSPDDLLSQWGGVLNYLKREDSTVSSVCSAIEPMAP
jgi:hypothetical protein